MTESGRQQSGGGLGGPMSGVWVSPIPKKSEDSMAEYIKYFDRVAKANGWGDEEAAKIFPGLLEVGSTVLDELEERALRSFELIKASFAQTNEVYREASVQTFFWSLVMMEEESVQDFIKRCKGLAKDCYPKFAKSNRDAIVRDRFVHGLRDELKSVVLNGKNGKLEEAVQTALMAQGVQETLGRGNYERGESRGLRSLDSGRMIELKCFNCNRAGHFARECPVKKEEHVDAILGNGDDRFMVKVRLNGRKTAFLVDTGATVSVLPGHWDIAKCEPATVQTVSGTTIKMGGREIGLVEFGGWKMVHPFWTGDVKIPVLGMDFLHKHGVVVDAGRGKIWMRRRSGRWHENGKKTKMKSFANWKGGVARGY